ncbi:MAG: tyrosine-type recombinase/integrase [Chloroflexi bacterium]|nr:tyrosine-type recombinase/integrase [Chloroflexota bacterium]MBV9599744.1 tyrosine-type recombinase/integrase [Chloroflexota bacterium]
MRTGWRLSTGPPSIWSFAVEIGTPLRRRNVLRAFKLALGRAGLPDVRFHDLRHAHATLLLRAGVALKTASARLGHSGIAITADLYQHVAGGTSTRTPREGLPTC